MILRRVIRHVRNQEWTAIGIDFLIVVLGVFLGIQVQEWSAERGERRLERVYLERLLADVDLSIETTAENRARVTGYSEGQWLVVSSLRACGLAEDQRDAFADGISDVGKVGPSVFVLSTMDEMLSAGHFSLLRNPDIRDVLNGLARDRGYQRDVFSAVTTQLAPLAAVTSQRVVRTYSEHRTPFDPVGWNDLAIDFEALCEDTAFQGAVSQARYLTDANRSLNDRALAKLRAARDALEDELSETDRVAGSPAGSSESSYVRAAQAGPHSFDVTVHAPAGHPLFLENCNGAINWALAEQGAPKDSFAWIVERDACLSSPIEIEPGASRSFELVVSTGGSAPPPGEYRLVLLGVFPVWTDERPLEQPQVARDRLLSNPVTIEPSRIGT